MQWTEADKQTPSHHILAYRAMPTSNIHRVVKRVNASFTLLPGNTRTTDEEGQLRVFKSSGRILAAAATGRPTCICPVPHQTMHRGLLCQLCLTSFVKNTLKGKGSPCSITELRVPELIPVLGSQPAGDVRHNPAVGCHYFPPGPQLPSQPLRGLLPISLLGEQRHDGCEKFA